MIKELSQAFENPKAFFEGAADKVIEDHQKEWQEFKTHMAGNSLEGRFRAGMIFGKLLMVTIGLATGIYRAAKLGAKAVTQLPTLVELAKKIKIRPGAIREPRGLIDRRLRPSCSRRPSGRSRNRAAGGTEVNLLQSCRKAEGHFASPASGAEPLP